MDAQRTPDGPRSGEPDGEHSGVPGGTDGGVPGARPGAAHGGGGSSVPGTGSDGSSARVAVVVPARNEASRIALTVLAARRLPGVDLVVVVDDVSTDSTARVAEESGAQVVRLEARSGRTAALQAGVARVGAVEEREAAAEGAGAAPAAPRLLLFLEADVQQHAAEAALLLAPVRSGTADAALALSTPEAGAASRRARRGIERATGFSAGRPVAVEICMSRAAFSAAEPLSGGAGAGAGLIIDLLRQGLRVVEVPVAWSHRPRPEGVRARLRELARWREVGRTLSSRRASR